MTAPTTIEPLRRALDVVARLEGAGIPVSLLGGLGVAVHRHGDSPASLDRAYSDVDIVVAPRTGTAVVAALAPTHAPNKRFNALHGETRLMLHRNDDGEQLDVFVGRFTMCHALDLSARLATSSPALSPADLFLTKAQVVEVNDKDLTDLVTLVHHHNATPAGDLAADVIDLTRLGEVCGADWGWYTTVTDNLPKVAARAATLLDPSAVAVVGERCARIADHLAAMPKSLRWRARAKLGRRAPWYELPEEIAHG